MTVYTDRDAVVARVSSTYTVPGNIDELLVKASELIDDYTLNFAQTAYDSEAAEALALEDTPYRDALARAVADQIEFWLEVGPEHDVGGLKGSLVAGRLQIHPVPALLGTRAKRTLRNAGLYWAGAAIG
jgi:hypothetical protein